MVTADTTPTAADLWRILDAVVDPEIPVLTLADLGVLRDVQLTDGDHVVVRVIPTYSGCPALETMKSDIRSTLADAGFDSVEVRTAHQPAWSTDLISDEARAKLAEFGIAPPGPSTSADPAVVCPRCSASETITISRFGSTACKALMVCEACREPFDYFKAV